MLDNLGEGKAAEAVEKAVRSSPREDQGLAAGSMGYSTTEVEIWRRILWGDRFFFQKNDDCGKIFCSQDG